MARFVELDEKDIVIRLLDVHDDILLDNGQLVEARAITHLKEQFGQHTRWLQFGNSKNPRKNSVALGMRYVKQLDMFVHHGPSVSDGYWIIEGDTRVWQSRANPAEYGVQMGLTRI